MKFTKTEIDLCRQIARKHKKEIEWGDWFIDTKKENSPFLCEYGWVRGLGDNVLIPLWTIEDCLEFLREKGFVGIQLLGSQSWVLWANEEQGGIYELLGDGKSPLEALLKAVLAVLEEK